MLTINNGCGFQLTFENGITVSVQFGYGHYCANRNNRNFSRPQERCSSDNAEVAVIGANGEWLTREVFEKLGWDDPCDDVAGYVAADEVAKLIAACQALPKVEVRG